MITQRPIALEPAALQDPQSPLGRIFAHSQQEPQLILVTGLSGVGKTTWCTQLIGLARDAGLAVSGLLSPSIFKDGRKIGIEVVDLHAGDHHQLARLREEDSANMQTPRWAFDEEAMAWPTKPWLNPVEVTCL